jgi:hypothetical protein
VFSVCQWFQWFQRRPVMVKIVDVLDEEWFEWWDHRIPKESYPMSYLFHERRHDQPYYETMQVYLNGHQITDRYNSSPEQRRKYCDKCGAETIH